MIKRDVCKILILFGITILSMVSCVGNPPHPTQSDPPQTTTHQKESPPNPSVVIPSEIESSKAMIQEQKTTVQVVQNNPSRNVSFLVETKQQTNHPLKSETSHIPNNTKQDVVLSSPETLSNIAQNKLPLNINREFLLAKGNYRIEKKITIQQHGKLIIPAGTKIEFQSNGILCLGTILAQGTKEEPILFSGENGWDGIVISGENSLGNFSYCKISGGIGICVNRVENNEYDLYTGNQIAGGAILYTNLSKGSLYNCEISHTSSQNAIEILYAKKITIQDCFIHHNHENGVSSDYSEVELTSNHISHNRLNGFVALGETSAKIHDNTFEENLGSAISVQNHSTVDILKNIIQLNAIGIDFFGSTKGTLKENIIHKNYHFGIICYHDSYPNIYGNEISENLICGIGIQQRSSPVIRNNNIHHNIQVAIAMLQDGNIELFENVISHSVYGIYREETTFINGKKELGYAETNNQMLECTTKEILGIPSFAK